MNNLKHNRLYALIPFMTIVFILIFQTIFSTSTITFAESNYLETADYGDIRDTMSDTWVGVDDLGRLVPTAKDEEVGELNKEKHVLMFYYTWSLPEHVTEINNNTEIINEYKKTGKWNWGPLHSFHYAMEPYYGYYRSDDPWVIRKDIQMLCDAGVDGVFFDAGNGYLYHDAYKAFFEENMKRKEEGQSYLKVTWMLKAGGPRRDVSRVLTEIYRRYYKKGLYDDFVYKINGKPLMLCPKKAVSEETEGIFEIRECWAWDVGEGQWPWLENSPQIGGWDWGSTASKREMISVAAAQHPTSNMGKSYSNGYQPSESNWKTNEGVYFKEQWERALELDPQFVLVTQWNEWIAQRFEDPSGNYVYFLGERTSPGGTYFVDTLNAEYSRDIAPMKGGYGDNYYYQFASYVRKFKGARDIPVYINLQNINIDDFSTISESESVFYDDLYDTMHRDHPGSAKNEEYYYKDNSGRNDFEEIRTASDEYNIYFYAKTVENITAPEGKNWMNLLLNTDSDYTTGWHGYDYIVNRTPNGKVTSIESFDKEGKYEFKNVGEASINYSENEMVICVPKKSINVPLETFTIDFKFADNIPEKDDIMLFIDKGDVAPNNRFNYRYDFAYQGTITPQKENVVAGLGNTELIILAVSAIIIIVCVSIILIVLMKGKKKGE